MGAKISFLNFPHLPILCVVTKHTNLFETLLRDIIALCRIQLVDSSGSAQMWGKSP